MKKMNVYEVILSDRESCYKVKVPAFSKKEALEYVQGNGEVEKVTDITGKYTVGVDKVAEALRISRFGQSEIDIITRALTELGLAE